MNKSSPEKIRVKREQTISEFSGTLGELKAQLDTYIVRYGEDAILSVRENYDYYMEVTLTYWELETDVEYERRLRKVAGYKAAAIKRSLKKEEQARAKEAAELALYKTLKKKFER